MPVDEAGGPCYTPTMLRIVSPSGSRDCAGINRRDFISIGTLGIGGLALPDLLAAPPAYLKDKSVVLLFLAGGPSHIETFDPHMDQPAPVCSMTGDLGTALPGVRFGGTFPGLAKRARDLAVVRSFQHPVGAHEKAIEHVLTAGHPERASMGSMVSRLRGGFNPETGLPVYSVLCAPEVDGQYRKELGRVLKGSNPGSMGRMYGPLVPDGKSQFRKDMELHLPKGRFENRQALLQQLDHIKRHIDQSGQIDALDRFQQRSIDLILNGTSEALSLEGEDPKLLARYDTSGYRVGKKVFRDCTLGHQLLMARRLCEAGSNFVTVQCAGWDMHADGNNPGMVKGMEMLGRPLDQALSVFLDDLKERGLSEKVLLVITGDFGRTPTVNKRGGRDHWARLGTLAFAGGGLNMGQVIGRSSRDAGEPASEPIGPHRLFGTILHTLFDVGAMRTDSRIPRELMSFIDTCPPIRELVG